MLRPPHFQDLDLDAHLARLDPAATARGLVLSDLIDRVRRAKPSVELATLAGVAPRRYLPFLSYPYADLLRMIATAAAVLHPEVKPGEGARRIGWTTYDTLLGTKAGRMAFSFFAGDVEGVLMNAARGYSISLGFGRVASERVGERHVVIRFRDLPGMLETYQVGVVEGAIRHCGEQPRVEIELVDLANADVHARW
jgi:uncharacterized protein (TIGR02265 family)